MSKTILSFANSSNLLTLSANLSPKISLPLTRILAELNHRILHEHYRECRK